MNCQILDLIINIPVSLFVEKDWDEKEFNKLNNEIFMAEEKFHDELLENLMGQNFIMKEDIIKEYLASMFRIYEEIFFCVFDDDDYGVPNLKALSMVKDFYQILIDQIGYICINHNIDLIKVLRSNPLMAANLNIDHYLEHIRFLQLNSGTLKNKLSSSFKNEDAFQLFEYLFKNFKITSPRQKASCIYRMMYSEQLIDENLGPTEFKKMIKQAPYNCEFTPLLRTESELGPRIKKHYQLLKEEFFKR